MNLIKEIIFLVLFLKEMESDDEQDYVDTINENEYLGQLFNNHANVWAFLNRGDKVFARSKQVDENEASVWLNYNTDIDGCVVELKSLVGINLKIRHLTVCPSSKTKLKEIKYVLKKHIDITKYSRDALTDFNHALGFQLFYEEGWECWIGLIPDSQTFKHCLTSECVRNLSFNAFEQMRKIYQLELTKYVKENIALMTLMKNDLDDLRRIFILPDDRSAMLIALQIAIDSISVQGYKHILFCFRFGEKMKGGLSMAGFDPTCIRKISAHAAVDISSSLDGVDLFWSMQGIQEVVGHHGTLSTCLSLTDCGNFQSNLELRCIDIRPELRRVCLRPDKLLFIQMYADVPHLKPKTRFHPVSGIIAGGLCFPKLTANAFSRDALRYISALEHNFLLLKRSTCRLEIVSEVSTVTGLIQATDVVDIKALGRLLKLRGMLVPMPDTAVYCIRTIGLWLTKEMKDMLSMFRSTGNVEATWRAYQFELACEKLLWGRPLCDRSFRYSINLGPGVTGASRSNSDALGFLALEPYTSCMAYESSIPNPSLWTASERISRCILRSVGVHDHIDASYPVVGRLILSALLKDLHDVGKVGRYFRYEQFLASLKNKDTNFQIVGAITINNLVELLVSKRRIGVNVVFVNLCNLIRKDLPLKEVIQSGIIEMGLKQFPALQTYDTHGNAVLNWDFRNNFWKIVDDSFDNVDSVSPLLYTQLVKCELERRGVIFPSKLKKLPITLPWIDPCIRKLSKERLTQEGLVLTLSFLSTVAFLMQGWFVDYDRLHTLFTDLPVKQHRLKHLEIQSPLRIPNFNVKNILLFRLHSNIPHQLDLTTQSKLPERVIDERDTARDEYVSTEIDNSRLIQNEFNSFNQNIENRPISCLTAGHTSKRAWDAKEMEIVWDLMKGNNEKKPMQLYQMYKTRCLIEVIPFRTSMAFMKKLRRLFPD